MRHGQAASFCSLGPGPLERHRHSLPLIHATEARPLLGRQLRTCGGMAQVLFLLYRLAGHLPLPVSSGERLSQSPGTMKRDLDRCPGSGCLLSDSPEHCGWKAEGVWIQRLRYIKEKQKKKLNTNPRRHCQSVLWLQIPVTGGKAGPGAVAQREGARLEHSWSGTPV